MKIKVDYDLCEATALCMKACPEVLTVDDDDNLNLATEEPEESLRAKIEEAVRLCPRQALALED